MSGRNISMELKNTVYHQLTPSCTEAWVRLMARMFDWLLVERNLPKFYI
jgi:hypothetical protein